VALALVLELIDVSRMWRKGERTQSFESSSPFFFSFSFVVAEKVRQKHFFQLDARLCRMDRRRE
jgi:hypothetical protein